MHLIKISKGKGPTRKMGGERKLIPRSEYNCSPFEKIRKKNTILIVFNDLLLIV